MVRAKRWTWPDNRSRGSAKVWNQLNREGITHVHMPDAPELALSNPYKLVKTLFGCEPLAIYVNDIKVDSKTPGYKPYAMNSIEAMPHIDQHLYMPAPVQLLICVRPADDGGGENYFVDTWKILKKLKKSDPDLYQGLFEVPRVIGFRNLIWLAPTFSLRCGNLVCVQSGFTVQNDVVGQLFEREILKAKTTKIKLEAGDIAINSNHRSLHARTAFKDPKRHLVRILVWFRKPMWAPKEFMNRANPVALQTEKLLAKYPLWAKKRLGYTGKKSAFKLYSRNDIVPKLDGTESHRLFESADRTKELIKIFSKIHDMPELIESGMLLESALVDPK